MKKIVILILAMVMTFTLAGCANNDENNAAIKAKIEETEVLVQEMITWYQDNGFLEGDAAAEIQPVVDELNATVEKLNAAYQEVVDDGGYSDSIVDEKLGDLDKMLEKFRAGLEELKAYEIPVE